MRILFTIPHFFNPNPATPRRLRRHGSQAADPRPRVGALTSCIRAVHELFCGGQCLINHADRCTDPANQRVAGRVDVVVCTTRDCHLLERVPVPEYYQHHATQAEPRLLGFECQAILREWLGAYDYYCYLEDDLILRDPWLFVKLTWFNSRLGDDKLLQPNRYEVGAHPATHKVYLDGDLKEHVTARFQDIQDLPRWEDTVLGTRVVFQRPLNPHAGCYFLNARQMEHWANQPYFLDRDTSFVGPLESAATLGIMRAFKVYKPAPENASFLEVQHSGTRFMRLIRPPDPTQAHAGGAEMVPPSQGPTATSGPG